MGDRMNTLLDRVLRGARGRFYIHLAQAIGLQAVQMVIAAVIGFTIINGLSKESYAIFSLVNLGISTLLGFASIAVVSVFFPFARSNGITHAKASDVIGHFRRQDRCALLIGVVVTVVFWIYSAVRNGWLDGGFWVLAGVGALIGWMQYEFRLGENAAKVLGNPILPLATTVASEAGRLIIVLGVVYLIPPDYAQGRLFALVAAMFLCATVSLARIRWAFPPSNAVLAEPIDDSSYRTLMRPLWFAGYFYHSSQMFRAALVYWVSGASVIAESAALGRLMMLFALVDKAVELVVIPRLGAINDLSAYLKKLTHVGGVMLMAGVGFLFSAWAFPDLWLWLLGSKYANLDQALLWSVSAAVIERLSGLVLFAQFARGQTRNQWWVPVMALAVFLAIAAMWGLDSAVKVSTALFVSAVANLLAQVAILWNSCKKEGAPSTH